MGIWPPLRVNNQSIPGEHFKSMCTAAIKNKSAPLRTEFIEFDIPL